MEKESDITFCLQLIFFGGYRKGGETHTHTERERVKKKRGSFSEIIEIMDTESVYY